jgi:hypothetical protein
MQPPLSTGLDTDRGKDERLMFTNPSHFGKEADGKNRAVTSPASATRLAPAGYFRYNRAGFPAFFVLRR